VIFADISYDAIRPTSACSQQHILHSIPPEHTSNYLKAHIPRL